MKNLLMKFIFALAFFGLTLGQSVTYLGDQRYPNVKDKCFLNETQEFIDFGGSLERVGVCRRYTCLDDFVVQIEHCPRYMVPENCEEIAIDLSQSYPDCCAKLRCIKDDGNQELRSTFL